MNNRRENFLIPFFLLIFFQFVILFSAYSQYGNEWINSNQSYYKIPVSQTGVYSIPFNDLRIAGVGISPQGSVQPSELKLYHRGVEQAVMLRNDSLFFYGERNDGTLDSLLYQPSSLQTNKFINLYSDTTAYFLTWASGDVGKRIPSLQLSSPTANETYQLTQQVVNFFDKYHPGKRYSSETWLAIADDGEGWCTWAIGANQQKVFPFTVTNVSTNGPMAEFFIKLAGEAGDFGMVNNNNMAITVQGGGQPDTTYIIPPFTFYDVQSYTAKIPLSYLSGGNLNVILKNLGSGMPSMVNTCYVTLSYPQTYQMNGLSFKTLTVPTINQVANIQLSNVPKGALLWDISNPNSISTIPYSEATGNINATVYGGSKLIAFSDASFLRPQSIKAVHFPVYTNESTADYIIITHKKIISAAHDYAKYRASVQGGKFDTLVAEVNNLYDRFSYGEKSPVAIKRYLRYLTNTGKPAYVFIIGKGLEINYNITGLYTNGPNYRVDPLFYINNTDPSVNREDLIPPAGFPSSDLLYVSGLNGADVNVPGLPIGRFAARDVNDVHNYLQKMIEHDTSSNATWRKNFLHLSGGHYQWEKDNFYNFVNSLKNIAEDTIYSGKVVKTISKKSSGSIDNSMQSSIADVVNSGVSYITSFGHTTPDFTDIDFGFASMDFYGYRNKGKYPLLYTNGCYSGHIFGWSSFAEDWVKTPDRGAIASIGHTHVGYISELQQYTTTFYRNAFDTRQMIGKPIGDLQLKTISSVSKTSSSPVMIATYQQMTLHGDPAVKVYMPSATDLMINNSRVSIKSLDGKPVTAVSESFAIQIIVDNQGLDFNDSLDITVKRTLNGKMITYGPLTFRPVKYRDTILFIIKSPDVSTFGENVFDVSVDSENKIAEIDEANNYASLKYFIPISGVVTLYPKEYSIVNKNPLNLVAQSTNLLTEEKDYYMEIDTSYLFKSSLKMSTTLKGTSIVKWENVSLPYLKDSTVYYWRVRYQDIPVVEDTLWGESSFIYIKDSPEGWSQSKFPQFLKDGTVKIDRNIPSWKWEFSKNKTPVYVRTVGNSWVRDIPDPYIYTPSMETSISIYGLIYTFRDFCDPNGIIAVAFDKVTGVPYTLNYGSFCEGVPGRENQLNVFTGLNSQSNQDQFKDYINAIPKEDAVLLVSTGQANYNSWDVSLKDLIKTSFGSDSIYNLTDGRPFVLLSTKGATKPLQEISIPDSRTSEVIMSDTIYSTNRSGFISSTLIGPASNWGTFYHDVIHSGTSGADHDSLMIIGVDINGVNMDTLSISQKDTLDLSQINQLSNFPYIRLLAKITDSVDLTPAYLRKWQVIYSGVPEGTMNTGVFGVNSYKPVTTMEGDTIKLCYAFENISNYSFPDTLQVRFTVTNSNTGPKVEWAKLTKLKSDSMVTFCYTVKTKGLEGNNILQAYVNPLIQKEQYYNNNILETSFTVVKDKVHPVLDVVFDGSHIMNGDIVSPSPMITITLNDENKFQIRENSNGIEVYILAPGQTVPQPVNLANYPGKQIGKNGQNSYQIDVNPKDLPNGKYTLIVKASDVAGNSSGTQDYKIDFEVINESTITNFYPYPNPFSTSTRFVFTVTGNEAPRDMIIQIMTVTGKVVREITQQEIGLVKIGNNKTDFAWDGTDEFGDKLANGVYLYRVIMKNSDTFKHRDTAGDKAFKKDWGKLYILR